MYIKPCSKKEEVLYTFHELQEKEGIYKLKDYPNDAVRMIVLVGGGDILYFDGVLFEPASAEGWGGSYRFVKTGEVLCVEVRK